MGTSGHSGLSWTARFFFGGLAVASAILGLVGLAEHLPTRADYADFSALDLLYYDLQLFVLDSSPLQNAHGLPWELEIARFTAPVVTAYVIFLAVESLVSEWFGRVRARLARDHSILCGPPEIISALADQIRRERGRPMLVGRDIRPGRWRGTLAVAGDPRRPETLARAGINRAKEVLVVGPDSAANAEVSVAVHAGGRRIACLVEAGDHELFRAIVRQGSDAGGLRPDTFRRDVQAARALIERCPPPRVPGAPARVLIIGYEGLGEAVLRRLVAAWAREADGSEPHAVVSVLDPHVPPDVIGRRHPEAAGLAVIAAHHADPRWLTDRGDLRLPGGAVAPGPLQVYVCLPDNGVALRTGDTVLRLLRGTQARVAVAVPDSPLIGRRTAPAARPEPDGLVLVNVVQEVYAVASLRIGPSERLARAIHDAYVQACVARGERNPSMLPWDQLPEYLRQSNREQAWEIGERLVAIGRSAVPVAEGAAVHNPPLTDEEVERLARLEHERWTAERTGAGWRRGPARDGGRLTHPDLVPWAELSEGARAKDLDAIRAIPDLLAGVGLQMITTRP